MDAERQQLRVLVVEDEALLRMSLMDMLEDMGHAAFEARNASTALNFLEAEERVDVMLIDIGLPGMDGRELARNARVLRPGLHMVFATGHQATVLKGVDLGATAKYLMKPFRQNDLERVFESLGVTARRAV